MKNDPTELIFDSADSRVRLETLKMMCHALAESGVYALGRLGAVQSRVDFDIVASPQRGSIIFLLQPVFYFVVDGKAFFSQAPDEIRSHLEELGSLAAVGAFVWTVLFGGEGIFQMFKRKANVRVAPDAPAVTFLENYLKRQLLDGDDQAFKRHLQAIVDVAAGSGASAVKIRVEDGEAVIIWDKASRTEPGLLFTYKPFTRPPPAFIRRISPAIKGRYHGKPVQLFLAEGFLQDGGGMDRVMVIWASTYPIPDPEERTARYVHSELVRETAGLELLEDAPQIFEGADAVVYVREAANMG